MPTLVHADGRKVTVDSPVDVTQMKAYGFVEEGAPVPEEAPVWAVEPVEVASQHVDPVVELAEPAENTGRHAQHRK